MTQTCLKLKNKVIRATIIMLILKDLAATAKFTIAKPVLIMTQKMVMKEDLMKTMLNK
jgi:hypothetical protein